MLRSRQVPTACTFLPAKSGRGICRELWMRASDRKPMIAVSAHTVAEVCDAAAQGTDFAVLAPIFEKLNGDVQGIGLDMLRGACASAAERRIPVLALGGITIANSEACAAEGAAGVAGIRLFQSGDIFETVRRLREIKQAGVP